MNLTVIIPNYNGIRFLPACLESLKNQTYTDFEILLVDNGSTDESLSLLTSCHPDVRILRLVRNCGFANAVNIGIARSSSPYIMLLNNDTVLAPDCIYHLMRHITKCKRIFSAGAQILTMSSPHKTDTSGDYYSIFGYAFCRGQGVPPTPRRSRHVFTNCGCAAVFRRSLLDKTGLLDSRFFAYLEDVDLGFRARSLGYINVHCPEAVVYHVGSATAAGTASSGKYSAFKVYLSARNNIWLQKKNLTCIQKLLHAPFSICGMLLKYLYFRRINLHHWYLKGCLAGMRLRQPYRRPGIKSFLRTEPWVLYGSILYIVQFFSRKLTPQ